MMCDYREDVAVPRADTARPNAVLRDDARAADDPIAFDAEVAPAVRQDSSELMLNIFDDSVDVFSPATTTLVAPHEIGIEAAPAPATRYCSSCRKNLVETHFRSPATKTCVVCLRMHKMYQRRRRRQNKKRAREEEN